MSYNQWRRFLFFEKELLVDEGGGDAPRHDLLQLKVTAVTSGKGYIVLGDTEGCITLCDRKLALVKFQAFERSVTKLHQLHQQNILVSIGDDLSASAVLKVWDMDKTDRNSGGFLSLFSRDLFEKLALPRAAVTCLTAAEDLSVILVGLQSGSVIVVQGDVQNNKATMRVLTSAHQTPVVCLGLHTSLGDAGTAGRGGTPNKERSSALMVVTTSHILCFHNLEQARMEVIDEQGCPPGAATYTDEGLIFVGRQEAVYCFSKEGRGGTYAFEGEKSLLLHMRGYLLVVSQDRTNAHTVTIYDLRNRLIAFAGKVGNVSLAVAEWGSVVLIGADGRLHRLTERDTLEKLDLLYKRNLYPLAVALAQSAQLDDGYIVDIQRKYGDHLYAKGDYSGAMSQYLLTVGRLEPSYVIRKFLDSQRIHNLTSYLQALHHNGLAHSQHTTLLVNCYTKLQDVARLDEFIGWKDVSYDVEAAIQTLRQGAYHQHALHLAKKNQMHDLCVRILALDLKEAADALEYISSLERGACLTNLDRYASLLMREIPEQVTGLLKHVCTTPAPMASEAEGPGDDALPSPVDYVHIFSEDHRDYLVEFLEFVSDNPSAARPQAVVEGMTHALLEQYLTIAALHEAGGGVKGHDANADEAGDAAGGSSAAGAGAGAGNGGGGGRGVQKAREFRKKAQALLTDPRARYDVDNALLLCEVNGFTDGAVLLLERKGLYKEVLEYYIMFDNLPKVMATARRFGGKDPGLWVTILHYLVACKQLHAAEMMEVVEQIEEGALLPPLIVVQIVSQHPDASVDLVRGYMQRSLESDMSAMARDRAAIKAYQEETHDMRQEIEALRTSARIVQSRNCSACGQTLDLPCVHFMCTHQGQPCSFHQRCLGENEKECPLCGPEAARVREVASALKHASVTDAQEDFHRQLNGQSSDAQRFSTIADFFSRGLFQ